MNKTDLTDLFFSATVFVMKKILPILLVATALLVPLYPVYAQNSIKPRAASAPGALKIERAMQIEENTLNREENMIQNKEERLQMLKDKIATRAAMLKEKLAKFKDKAKAQRVENINSSLYKVDQNQTAYIQQILTKLSQMLERAKNLSLEAAAAGQDVTTLNEAINNAQTAWNQANDANTAQMENDYTIAVNTETTVAADAKAARNSLHTDLKSVREKVKAARKALVDVFNTAKALKGANNGQ